MWITYTCVHNTSQHSAASSNKLRPGLPLQSQFMKTQIRQPMLQSKFMKTQIRQPGKFMNTQVRQPMSQSKFMNTQIGSPMSPGCKSTGMLCKTCISTLILRTKVILSLSSHLEVKE